MSNSLIIHLAISLFSLSGLLIYYYAFRLGRKKYEFKMESISRLPEKLYFLSAYPAFSGMPFPLWNSRGYMACMIGWMGDSLFSMSYMSYSLPDFSSISAFGGRSPFRRI